MNIEFCTFQINIIIPRAVFVYIVSLDEDESKLNIYTT